MLQTPPSGWVGAPLSSPSSVAYWGQLGAIAGSHWGRGVNFERIQTRPRHPCGGRAAICGLVTTFESCWGMGRGGNGLKLYADQIRPHHPGWAAICDTVATFATFEGCWEAQRSGALRRFRLDLAIPEGLRSARLPPFSRAAGKVSGIGAQRGFRFGLAIPGGLGGHQRLCRRVRRLLGGPAE